MILLRSSPSANSNIIYLSLIKKLFSTATSPLRNLYLRYYVCGRQNLEYNLQSVTADFESKERGYYIYSVEEDYPVNIIIAAGMFSTGGYDIFIVDMDYDGKTFTVTVRETCPGPTDVVFEAFTYPYCEIQLNKLPESVRVVDENGAEFDCLHHL